MTGVIPETPAGPGAEPNRDDGTLFPGIHLTETIIGHIADHARRTVEAAMAGRVVSTNGDPGVLDLVLDPTPLSAVFYEVVEELRKVRPRQRIAQVLRLAADIIDSPASAH
jgi:hypothetical protein